MNRTDKKHYALPWDKLIFCAVSSSSSDRLDTKGECELYSNSVHMTLYVVPFTGQCSVVPLHFEYWKTKIKKDILERLKINEFLPKLGCCASICLWILVPENVNKTGFFYQQRHFHPDGFLQTYDTTKLTKFPALIIRHFKRLYEKFFFSCDLNILCFF